MVPIDLPPKPALGQLPAVPPREVVVTTQSTNSVTRTKIIEIRYDQSHLIHSSLASPTSLIPLEQLVEPSIIAPGFAHSLTAQLPTLPSDTNLGPKLPAVEGETIDAVDAVIDSEDIDDIQSIDQIDIETVTPPIDVDPINGGVNPNELDLDPSPDAPEEISIPEGIETPDRPNNVLEDGTPPPLDPSKLEITADTQIFNSGRQVVIAQGNVVFKLNNAFLLADELWVNLTNRYVLAEGNVILTRGEQQVRGERAEYNLIQEAGTLFETRGELFLPELEDDFASPLEAPLTSRSVFDPLNPDESLSNVTGAGGLQLSSSVSGTTPGSLPDTQGGVRRLRFEAARVNFDAESWVAEEVRLTNDPFSPPELEFRTDRLTLTTLSPTADLLTTNDPRLVFDQGLSLPLLKSKYVLNRGAVESNQVNPFLVSINSDSRDRGGVFLETEVPIVRNESTSFSITPQYFLERAADQGVSDPDVFGFEADFDRQLSLRSNISARATVTSLDLDQIEDNFRGSIRNRNLIGDHLLAAEYSYRDRLFNGSLGFQDVRSSLGAVLLSPTINLDGRGLSLTYQAGAQLVTARTDRADLLDSPLGGEDLVTLGRAQGSVRLIKGFNLWLGKPLPATQTEGLRYTPVPIVPFLNLTVSLSGVGSYYTNGDLQETLAGDVRLDGQLGHLSNNFFDYTRFNLGYYRDLISSDNSPFLFDRNVDDSILTFGILQQIIGPILLGFQTSINLDTGNRINTEIIGEYSRRTYGLVLRYSPTQSTGSIGFRLSDFNWLGNGNPFDNPNIRQVESGVLEQK